MILKIARQEFGKFHLFPIRQSHKNINAPLQPPLQRYRLKLSN